jgi:hypothetical protein
MIVAMSMSAAKTDAPSTPADEGCHRLARKVRQKKYAPAP